MDITFLFEMESIFKSLYHINVTNLYTNEKILSFSNYTPKSVNLQELFFKEVKNVGKRG